MYLFPLLERERFMKVKVSVKKLHRMEQMWKQRCEGNKRRYRREVRGWEHENQLLKNSCKNDKEYFENLFEDKARSHTQQLAEINELSQKINGLVDENDDLKVKVAMMEESMSLLQQRS